MRERGLQRWVQGNLSGSFNTINLTFSVSALFTAAMEPGPMDAFQLWASKFSHIPNERGWLPRWVQGNQSGAELPATINVIFSALVMFTAAMEPMDAPSVLGVQVLAYTQRETREVWCEILLYTYVCVRVCMCVCLCMCVCVCVCVCVVCTEI